VNTFQPEILLIGGGICKEGETLTKPLAEFIEKESYSIDKNYSTKLATAKLGNDAGIIGAAYLWKLERWK
jgi:glucokinase